MAIIPRARPDVDIGLSGIGARNEARISDAGAQAIGEATRGIQQGLGALSQVAQQQQDKADVHAYMEAQRRLDDWENGWNDPNNPKGVESFKGKDALGLRDTILPDFDKATGDIAQGLSPRAAEQFRNYAATRRAQVHSRANSYASRELGQWEEANRQASAASSANNIVNAYQRGDVADAASLRAAAVSNIYADAAAEGLPASVAGVRAAAFESGVHASIVESLLVRDPLAAKDYYEQHQDGFLPDVRTAVESKIRTYADDAVAEQAVDEALVGERTTREAPADYAAFRRRLESGGNPNAKNPNSSATGPDQFIEDTWLRTVNRAQPAWAGDMTRDQVLAARTDPEKSAEMAAALDAENAQALERAGVAVTNETLYAAHHFGAAGGVKFGLADGDTPMSAILSPAALKANGYLADLTKAEVVANWNRRAGGKVATQAPPATLGEAIAAVRSDPRLSTPSLRKAAEAKVRSRWQIAEADKADARSAALERANLAIETADPATPLRAILGADFIAMAEGGYVDAFEKRLAERRTGATVASNPVVLAALEEGIYRAASGSDVAMAGLRSIDPYDPTLQLSPADRKRIGEDKRKLLAGDEKDMRKAASAYEVNRTIDQYRKINLNISNEDIKRDKDKYAEAVAFEHAMRGWVSQFSEANQREPTFLEVRKQADIYTLGKLKFTATEPGRLWGTNEVERTVAQLEIPASVQRHLVDRMTEEGVPVTGPNIAQAYRNYVRGAR